MPILRIAPRWLEEPLRVVDGKGSIEVVDIDDLDLSEELADRIEAWVDVFDATVQPGQSAFSGFADEASERLWRREAASLAADIAGTWKGTAETPNGSIERTFVFKTDGSKVTGESNSQMMGKSVIKNGKLEGDTLTFSLDVKFQDNEMTLNYSGKVSGDTMKLKVEGPNDMVIEYQVKKVS